MADQVTDIPTSPHHGGRKQGQQQPRPAPVDVVAHELSFCLRMMKSQPSPKDFTDRDSGYSPCASPTVPNAPAGFGPSHARNVSSDSAIVIDPTPPPPPTTQPLEAPLAAESQTPLKHHASQGGCRRRERCASALPKPVSDPATSDGLARPAHVARLGVADRLVDRSKAALAASVSSHSVPLEKTQHGIRRARSHAMLFSRTRDWGGGLKDRVGSQLIIRSMEHQLMRNNGSPQRPAGQRNQSSSTARLKFGSGRDEISRFAEESLDMILRRFFSISLDEFAQPCLALEEMGRCLDRICTFSSDPTCLSNGSSHNTTRGASHGHANRGSRKRYRKGAQNDDNDERRDDDEGDEGDYRNEDGRNDGDCDPTGKRLKREQPTANLGFGCPFRKRNPSRFNIRDHERCAHGEFQTFSALKSHIGTFHLMAPTKPHKCLRCFQRFETEKEHRDHTRSATLCEVVDEKSEQDDSLDSSDPEEGINPGMVERLKDRTKSGNVKKWPQLWALLFGEKDPPKPPEYEVPVPVEIFEIRDALSADRNNLINRITPAFGPSGMTEQVFDRLVAACEAGGVSRDAEFIRMSQKVMEQWDYPGRRINVEIGTLATQKVLDDIGGHLASYEASLRDGLPLPRKAPYSTTTTTAATAASGGESSDRSRGLQRGPLAWRQQQEQDRSTTLSSAPTRTRSHQRGIHGNGPTLRQLGSDASIEDGASPLGPPDSFHLQPEPLFMSRAHEGYPFAASPTARNVTMSPRQLQQLHQQHQQYHQQPSQVMPALPREAKTPSQSQRPDSALDLSARDSAIDLNPARISSGPLTPQAGWEDMDPARNGHDAAGTPCERPAAIGEFGGGSAEAGEGEEFVRAETNYYLGNFTGSY